jgi:CRISPR-associated endonuclease/helicase Cas3
METWAHVREGGGNRSDGRISHDLATHLREVAEQAGGFAAPFASAEWGWLAGLWHDLGKYQPPFQAYLRKANGMDAHIETPGKVKHAIAGAIQAADSLGPYGRLLAYLIAGHHAGLPDWHPAEAKGAALSQELRDEAATLAQAKSGGAPAEILEPGIALSKPPIRAKNFLQAHVVSYCLRQTIPIASI